MDTKGYPDLINNKYHKRVYVFALDNYVSADYVNDQFSENIRLFKWRGMYHDSLLDKLTSLYDYITESRNGEIQPKFDYMTIVPNSKKGGYNGFLDKLAKDLGDRIGLEYGLLIDRIKSVKSQKGLSFSERAINQKGSLNVSDKIVKNKSILILDDICTTGSTLLECQKVLYDSGARQSIYNPIAMVIGTTTLPTGINSVEINPENSIYDSIQKLESELNLKQ